MASERGQLWKKTSLLLILSYLYCYVFSSKLLKEKGKIALNRASKRFSDWPKFTQ